MNRYTYPTMADHLGDFTTARNGTKNWMERMSEERDNKKCASEWKKINISIPMKSSNQYELSMASENC